MFAELKGQNLKIRVDDFKKVIRNFGGEKTIFLKKLDFFQEKLNFFPKM